MEKSAAVTASEITSASSSLGVLTLLTEQRKLRSAINEKRFLSELKSISARMIKESQDNSQTWINHSKAIESIERAEAAIAAAERAAAAQNNSEKKQ